MSDETTQTWLRQAATARPSARRIRLVTDRDIVTRYVPRLAGRNVHLSEGPMWYDTRAEAVEAARRVRNRIAAEAKIDDACMWYRHDFGLLSEKERDSVRFEARQWFRAWGKALSNGDDYAALLRAPRGEGEAEPVAWGVEYRRRGVGDRWYYLSTYTNELDACERARNVERAMRVLECRVIPLYASPAAALRSEAQAEDTIPVSALRSEIARLRAHRLLPYLAWARLCALAGGEPVGEDTPAARRGEGGGE